MGGHLYSWGSSWSQYTFPIGMSKCSLTSVESTEEGQGVGAIDSPPPPPVPTWALCVSVFATRKPQPMSCPCALAYSVHSPKASCLDFHLWG